MAKLICILISCIAILPSLVSASDVLVWQGQYYTGTTFNIGTYEFNFTVYDDITAGTQCYSNKTNITTGTWGQWYSEQFGVGTACSDITKDYFLNININGVDQPPRRRLTMLNLFRKSANIDLENNNLTSTGKVSYNEADWTGGNTIYVPINGDIQTYVNNAAAGDTLILASGKYIITSTITINKELNIVGQGSAGFSFLIITPSHGTLISSTTSGVTVFNINHSNVRIAYLSIDLVGAGSTGISTTNNLKGIVFKAVDVIIDCSGIATGYSILGSDVIMRDSTFFVHSTDSTAMGLRLLNDEFTTQNSTADLFTVTGTVQGGSQGAYCYVSDDENTVDYVPIINLYACIGRSLSGTPNDIALMSTSDIDADVVINSFLSTFDGADYDVYQGTGHLNLGGSILVNNKIFGNPTYRATIASGIGVFGGTMTLSTGNITDTSGTINFGENLTTTGNLNVSGNITVGKNLWVGGCIQYNCSQITGCVTLGTCT